MQLQNRPRVLLIAGRSGSGKSTFAVRYLLNVRATVRFVFDPDGEAASRCRVAPVSSPAGLDRAVSTGWVVFDPAPLFGADLQAAFRFFADWAWGVSQGFVGRKLFMVDEVWRYCSPGWVPPELAQLVQAGRKWGVEPCFITQRPNRVNESILGEVTECVAFDLGGVNALESLGKLGFPVEKLAGLPAGRYVSHDFLCGRTVEGAVF